MVTEPTSKKQKRSTLRLKNYYRNRKFTSKLILSSIISNNSDKRYYACVTFLTFKELGLLDTGANVSCIGSDLAKQNFTKYKEFFKLNSCVKTADGKLQKVEGYLHIDVDFRNETRRLKILIVPSITQNLILGLDFWRAFNLAPDIFGDVLISTNNDTPPQILSELYNFNSMTQRSLDLLPQSRIENSTEYPLTYNQRLQLDTIVELFPNFEKQGLGRTDIITHDIDVGNAVPVKH